MLVRARAGRDITVDDALGSLSGGVSYTGTVSQGAVGTVPSRAAATPVSSETVQPPRRRGRLASDLTILAVVGVLLIAALGAGAAALYREFYSASAFVERYVGMLADGQAANALALPGVSVDSAELESAGMPSTASDALLRQVALAPLSDIKVVSERVDDGVTHVTVAYKAGSYPGTTTFAVEPNGMVGVAPTWRFAKSPLAVVDLTVLGSMTFDVNGFQIDKRQVSPDGVDADPAAAVPLLVFSPGVYSVTVDSLLASTEGVAVLSDSPLTTVPVSLQALPTEQFVSVVTERVEGFLHECATQEVLQPTACPFGFPVQDRIVSPPTWSIISQPAISIVPDGAAWRIPAADAVAHIEVEIRSLFDGSVRQVSEDVPFIVTGKIAVLPDGTASIMVSGPEPD